MKRRPLSSIFRHRFCSFPFVHPSSYLTSFQRNVLSPHPPSQIKNGIEPQWGGPNQGIVRIFDCDVLNQVRRISLVCNSIRVQWKNTWGPMSAEKSGDVESIKAYGKWFSVTEWLDVGTELQVVPRNGYVKHPPCSAGPSCSRFCPDQSLYRPSSHQ